MLDLLIRGGHVHDGERFLGQLDIGLRGETIQAVGRLEVEAACELDARGMLVCPGFIDAHSHADLTLPGHPACTNLVAQGITTVVAGNCGLSPAPCGEAWPELPTRLGRLAGLDEGYPRCRSFGQWLEYLDQLGIGVNVAPLVGLGTIRGAVLGPTDTAPASASAVKRMLWLLDEALEAGAFGASAGLDYVPGRYAGPDELAALLRGVARRRGIFACHLRHEGDGVRAALEEVLNLAGETGVALQVSHLKAVGRSNWGTVPRLLERIERARQELDVACDAYPYRFSAVLIVRDLLPPWCADATPNDLARLARDPEQRRRLLEDLDRGRPGWGSPLGDFRWDYAVVSAPGLKEVRGRSLAELAARADRHPLDVLVELYVKCPDVAFSLTMSETDVRAVMAHQLCLLGSDSVSQDRPGGGRRPSHPRGWGACPRFLGRYVRRMKVAGWEEAISRMTARVADRFGIARRGRLRPGACADLVVLDPQQVDHDGGLSTPRRPPRGIRWVLVNGRLVVDEGQPTGVRAGRVLRRV